MSDTDVVVLNSLSLITNDLMGNWGASYDCINLYFDNDDAGNYAVNRIRNALTFMEVADLSKITYPNHKDYNDFLCQKQNPNDNG